MAPTLRSSRNTSQNPSRPITPQNPPNTEPVRPKKQRKTGPKTKKTTEVAAETTEAVEAVEDTKPRKVPAAKKEKAPAKAATKAPAKGRAKATAKGTKARAKKTADADVEMPDAPPLEPQNTQEAAAVWKEPPLAGPKPGATRPPGRKLAPLNKSNFGYRPNPKDLAIAEAAPRSMGPIKLHIKLSAPLSQQETGASSTPDQTGADSSTPLGDSSNPITRPPSALAAYNGKTPSNVNGFIDPAAAAQQQSVSAALDSLHLPEGYTIQKVYRCIDGAIERATDPTLAAALRVLKADSARDPFLLSVLAKAAYVTETTKDPTHPDTQAFQQLVREAKRRIESGSINASEREAASVAAPEMERVASGSTVKSAGGRTAKGRGKGGKGRGKKGGRPAKKATAQPTPATEEQGAALDPTQVAVTVEGDKNQPFKPRQVSEKDRYWSDFVIGEKRKLYEQGKPTFKVAVEDSDARVQGREGVQEDIPPVTRSFSPVVDFSESEAIEPPRKRARIQEPAIEIAESSERTQPAQPVQNGAAAEEDEEEVTDVCVICKDGGNLVCCDGCNRDYHPKCLKIPRSKIPKGSKKWFCPSCQEKGPIATGAVREILESAQPVPFSLPESVRGSFKDTGVGEDGKYVDRPDQPARPPVRERPKQAQLVREHRLRKVDSKGRAILCQSCGRPSHDGLEMLLCDHCQYAWHVDCLTVPPTYVRQNLAGQNNPQLYWRCPNHVEHVLDELAPQLLGRFRRPRHPKYVDIDVIPDDADEAPDSQEDSVVRVKESGIIQDFIGRVKRDRLEAETNRAWAEARARIAEDVARQAIGLPETRLDPAEVEAAMGLVSLSQSQAPSEATRYGSLISQLVANAPAGAMSTELSELEMLRSVKALVDQRILDLSGN